MTTDQHIEKMETDITEVKGQLGQLISLVEKMNKGLYGDYENDQVGVIGRQKIFTKELDDLRAEIREIHAKNNEQDVALRAKKTIKSDLYEAGKDILYFIIKAVLLIGIIKGFVDKDALL